MSSNSGKINKNYLDDEIGEFPRLDERYSMLNYRHGFYASSVGDHPPGVSFNSVTHIDHKTQIKDFFTLKNKEDALGEPIFVPSSKDSDEGEGYLIALAYRGKENRSDLLIFNAMDVSSGPIATAQLPHRIPYGFHGNWRQG